MAIRRPAAKAASPRRTTWNSPYSRPAGASASTTVTPAVARQQAETFVAERLTADPGSEPPVLDRGLHRRRRPAGSRPAAGAS